VATGSGLQKSASPKARGRLNKSTNRLAIERFMRNRLAVAGIVILAVILLMCVFAPFLTHWNPTKLDIMNADAPPSAAHWLGTNNAGTDYWAADLYGGRADLLIGFLDMAFVMTVGILLGGLSGFYGGWVDSAIMRVCDFMFNFPFFLLIIVITAVFDASNIWILILVIGLTGWPGVTRLVRGLFLGLRDNEYILAAKMSGSGAWRIIYRHMLPNSLGPLVVNATLQMAFLISAEAALSVIGFGVIPPQPSWGNVLSSALDFMTLQTEPWAWIPPALFITVTILCINFTGDGLRDAFDPSFEK
jgi:peptide/nickel transport system permease protein